MTRLHWLLSCWLALTVCTNTARATSPSAQQILACTTPAPEPGYSLYAIRVGVTPDARRSIFIRDPELPAKIPIAFAFWVVRGFGRTILLDTGFVSPNMKRRWRVQQYRDPAEGLAAVGLSAKDVTDVVISHHHWDHIDGLMRFPHATIWISKQALAAAQKWAIGASPELARALDAARREKRIRLTESLTNVTPHVVTVRVGQHAAGFQYLVVRGHDRSWVLASDVVPLRANLERRRVTGDSTKTGTVIDTMDALVHGDLTRIVAGHEPGGFDGAGIRRIWVPHETR